MWRPWLATATPGYCLPCWASARPGRGCWAQAVPAGPPQTPKRPETQDSGSGWEELVAAEGREVLPSVPGQTETPEPPPTLCVWEIIIL